MIESKIFSNLKRINYPVVWNRIETGGITISIPDIYYFTPFITGWIELKILEYSSGMFKIPYRPGQISWLTRHRRTNKYTYCLGWWNKNYYLINKFVKETKSLSDICIWSGKSLKDVKLKKYLFGEYHEK